jgi:hypothetical protein
MVAIRAPWHQVRMLKRVVVVILCTVLGCSGGKDLAEEPEIVPIAGGQTGDFGDGDAPVCELRARGEIAPERAVELGFPLDGYLALLSTEHQGALHWGPARCEASAMESADPTISLRVEPDSLRIFHDQWQTRYEGVACPDGLSFEAIVNLESSDGLLRGRFYALFSGDATQQCIAAVPDLRNFRGPFRFKADLARPHWGVMEVNFCFSGDETWGKLRTVIHYTDDLPATDEGPSWLEDAFGGHWHPLQDEERPDDTDVRVGVGCSDPLVPDAQGADTLSLSEYEGSRRPPTVKLAVRADAVEPAADVAVKVIIDGRVAVQKDVGAGTLLELGSFETGTHVKLEVENAHGAGSVRANILANDCFRASESCDEPNCVAEAEYTVSYSPCVD